MPCLNFTWAQFCVYTRFVIFYILHVGFTITSSNGKTVEYIVPTLLGFLQVKYQGIDDDPFTTHPKTMRMAIVSNLLYGFLAYGMKLQRFGFHGNPPTYPFHFMVFFGNMAMAALASIFFPDSIGPILYVLCVFISAGELLYWVNQRDEELTFMRQIRRYFFKTLRICSFGYFSMEQRDILPRFVINNLQ